MFSSLGREVDGLIRNAIELSYFMRGAIPYESMLLRTPGERQRIGDFVTDRLKSESKKSFPVY